MSISQELRRAGPYISDGSTKAFTFSFKVMKGSDLSVVVADNKDTSVSDCSEHIGAHTAGGIGRSP